MPIDSLHPEYEKISKRWTLVRSIVKNDAKKQLRNVDPDNVERCNQYKGDAILTNFTRLTKEGLTGLVFRKHGKKKIPAALEYLDLDSTGCRFELDQLVQKILGEILETGRYGILVDFPQANLGSPQKLARLKPYNAESILDWDYKDFGNEYKLSYVKLLEEISYIDIYDNFTRKTTKQYRVLILNDNMEYMQGVFDENFDLIGGEYITPLDYNGNPLDTIPFTFIGSENNDAFVDAIPLYDLSVVNLGHYKASADLMETMYVCGQVVPVVNTGETGEDQWNEVNPGGIKIGSRTPIVVGTGGDFYFRQANANTLPQQVMKDLQEQAAAIGARIIAPPGGRETAESARNRYSSQNSVLYTIVRNIQLAIEISLYYAAVFMMENPEISEYELNKQFYEENADPNLIAQLWVGLDRQAVNIKEIRNHMRKSGIDLEDDDDFTPEEIDPMMGVDDTGEPDDI